MSEPVNTNGKNSMAHLDARHSSKDTEILSYLRYVVSFCVYILI